MPLVRPSRLARTLPLAALAPLLACGEPTAVGALSLTLGPPHFEGVIAALPDAAPGPLLVEREPVRDACSDRMTIAADDVRTEVVRADGTRGVVAELEVGRRVSVWFVTPILTSCTPSSTAGTIVLR